MNNKKTVISFGHIPREIGGKQHSGLAQVMWRLANEINRIKSDYKVIFVSTDIYNHKSKIQNTDVIGWNPKLLLKYSIIDPAITFKYIYFAIQLKLKYKFSFLNTLLKLIFWGKMLLTYKDEIDIVHIHGVNNFAILNKLLTPTNYKVIVTIHGITGNDETQPHKRIQFKLEKTFIRNENISSIVFVTEAIRKAFLQLYGKPTSPNSVILNGYDALIFNVKEPLKNPNQTSKLNLLIIGGVTVLKGQRRVLEALSLLPSTLKNKFILTLIGVDANNKVPELMKFAEINKIELKFLGYQKPSNIAIVLQNIDYLILPSSTEGFGLVCLESIACGTPVIIPKYLPLSQEFNVLNNLNSIKIEDHLTESIAKCLLELNKSHNLKEEISNTISHLTWPNIVKKYIALYDLVLKS
jgi:glycosyltransferase involved in cell wall biosynthesis